MSLKVLNSKVDRYSLGLATSFYKKKGTRFEKEAKRNKEMGYSDLYNI